MVPGVRKRANRGGEDRQVESKFEFDFHHLSRVLGVSRGDGMFQSFLHELG